jgi:hypothetical protein
LINAVRSLQNIGLLPTVGLYYQPAKNDWMGVDHPEGRKHQVVTLTTGHYSKAHCHSGYVRR